MGGTRDAATSCERCYISSEKLNLRGKHPEIVKRVKRQLHDLPDGRGPGDMVNFLDGQLKEMQHFVL